MPFKTKYGTHYHERQSCPAIAGRDVESVSNTAGLTPCSICCGGGGQGGASSKPSFDIGGASGAGGDSGKSEFAQEIPRQDAIMPPADNITPLQAQLLKVLEMGTPPDDIKKDTNFMQVMTEIDPDFLSSLDMMGLNGFSSSTPVPPIPESLDAGVRIDVDGTIIRDGNGRRRNARPESPEDRGADLARRIDNISSARSTSADRASRTRGILVTRTENEANRLPEGREREMFRRATQATWNTMHPEAPVLEWSREDEGYVSDSKACVVMSHRDDETGEHVYSVLDKSTGRDVTDEIYRRDLVMRQVNRGISDIEVDMLARDRHQEVLAAEGLYRSWLEEKRQQSDLFRYHGGAVGLRGELWDEFVSETEYKPSEPTMRPTDDERERLADLYDRKRNAQRELDEVMMQYEVDDETLALIRPQYARPRRNRRRG